MLVLVEKSNSSTNSPLSLSSGCYGRRSSYRVLTALSVAIDEKYYDKLHTQVVAIMDNFRNQIDNCETSKNIVNQYIFTNKKLIPTIITMSTTPVICFFVKTKSI